MHYTKDIVIGTLTEKDSECNAANVYKDLTWT